MCLHIFTSCCFLAPLLSFPPCLPNTCPSILYIRPVGLTFTLSSLILHSCFLFDGWVHSTLTWCSDKPRCLSGSQTWDQLWGATLQKDDHLALQTGIFPHSWHGLFVGLSCYLSLWWICCFLKNDGFGFSKYGQRKDGDSGIDVECEECTKCFDLLGHHPEAELKGSCQSLHLNPFEVGKETSKWAQVSSWSVWCSVLSSC